MHLHAADAGFVSQMWALLGGGPVTAYDHETGTMTAAAAVQLLEDEAAPSPYEAAVLARKAVAADTAAAAADGDARAKAAPAEPTLTDHLNKKLLQACLTDLAAGTGPMAALFAEAQARPAELDDSGDSAADDNDQ